MGPSPPSPGPSPPQREEDSEEEGGPARPLHPDVLRAHAQDVLSLLLALRFVNCLCVRTFFQPDEYFQALEPAWRLAFGPGSGAWLTWEWRHHLRSSLHPALFGLAYVAADRALDLFQPFPPFRAFLLTHLPKVLQSVIAALGDFYTWKLAGKLYGQPSRAASAALWLTVLNPWQWFCSTRTFSNSLETTLTVAALSYWPWQLVGEAPAGAAGVLRDRGRLSSLRVSLLLAAAAVVLRPTNLLIWLAVATLTLSRVTLDGEGPLSLAAAAALARESALCGSAVLALSAVSDRLYFGAWTFPPYHFLRFNLSQDLAVFYGHMPWHYYLSQGLPLLTTTFLPFAAVGLYRASSPPPPAAGSPPAALRSNALRVLAFAVVATVAALSLVAHKEVRFIYPLLPVLHVLAAPCFGGFFAPGPSPGGDGRPARRPLLALVLAANLALAGYLSLFHQPAPVAAVTYLRSEYERLHLPRLDLHPGGPAPQTPPPAEAAANGTELFALFLTPCHSTPWRSHLVWPGLRARALTCEPPLHTAPRTPERAGYLDEADRFYRADPADGSWGARFLAEEVWPPLAAAAAGGPRARGGEVPRFIVGFEGVEAVLQGFFGEGGEGRGMGVRLARAWEGWNGLFNEDWRRRGRLVVWDTGVYGGR